MTSAYSLVATNPSKFASATTSPQSQSIKTRSAMPTIQTINNEPELQRNRALSAFLSDIQREDSLKKERRLLASTLNKQHLEQQRLAQTSEVAKVTDFFCDLFHKAQVRRYLNQTHSENVQKHLQSVQQQQQQSQDNTKKRGSVTTTPQISPAGQAFLQPNKTQNHQQESPSPSSSHFVLLPPNLREYTQRQSHSSLEPHNPTQSMYPQNEFKPFPTWARRLPTGTSSSSSCSASSSSRKSQTITFDNIYYNSSPRNLNNHHTQRAQSTAGNSRKSLLLSSLSPKNSTQSSKPSMNQYVRVEKQEVNTKNNNQNKEEENEEECELQYQAKTYGSNVLSLEQIRLPVPPKQLQTIEFSRQSTRDSNISSCLQQFTNQGISPVKKVRQYQKRIQFSVNSPVSSVQRSAESYEQTSQTKREHSKEQQLLQLQKFQTISTSESNETEYLPSPVRYSEESQKKKRILIIKKTPKKQPITSNLNSSSC